VWPKGLSGRSSGCDICRDAPQHLHQRWQNIPCP
jgi:hypothetical protein